MEFAFYRGQGNAVKADGPPRYTLMNFVYNREHDNYSWVEVGNYSDVNNEQHLDFERSFKTKMANYPPSVCSEPCLLGQVNFVPSVSVFRRAKKLSFAEKCSGRPVISYSEHASMHNDVSFICIYLVFFLSFERIEIGMCVPSQKQLPSGSQFCAVA